MTAFTSVAAVAASMCLMGVLWVNPDTPQPSAAPIQEKKEAEYGGSLAGVAVAAGMCMVALVLSRRRSRRHDSGDCPICFEKMGTKEKPMACGQCGHIICHECLITTVQKRQECPICRAQSKVKDIRKVYF